jgi:hypothetical protein
MIIWFLIVGGSLCLGLMRKPWWTVFAGPLASLALGMLLVAAEPPDYDMSGFGLDFGLVVSIVAALAWLAGRGLAALASADSNEASPQDSTG